MSNGDMDYLRTLSIILATVNGLEKPEHHPLWGFYEAECVRLAKGRKGRNMGPRHVDYLQKLSDIIDVVCDYDNAIDHPLWDFYVSEIVDITKPLMEGRE